ncbi:hypothetical protein GBA52_013900 [Prunus armeniaca]|nr:hypothetical protein GBA52_013900 [Prunus armeniaca]
MIRRMIKRLGLHQEEGGYNCTNWTVVLIIASDGINGAANNNSTSIANLFSLQLPQTPPLHQQHAMLGSLGDGLFRTPYQLPGMNWISST